MKLHFNLKMSLTLNADYVIIGGGIAGVSCVEYLSEMSKDHSIVLVSATPYIKMATDVKKIGKIIEDFNIIEKHHNELLLPNVKFLLATVKGLNAKLHEIHLSTGQTLNYSKLCICTGAKPKIISHHPNVLSIRDLETVTIFQKKLEQAKRCLIVGNGGIAIEMVHEIRNCEVYWIVKNDSIGSTFFDAGAAQFFMPHLKEHEPIKTRTFKYTVENKPNKGEIGSALGPDWHLGLSMSGQGDKRGLNIEYNSEVKQILDKEEFERLNLKDTESSSNVWPLYVELTNGKFIGCDFIISATGVIPNTEVFLHGNSFETSNDGGILVDEYMRSNEPNVYVAGDACTPSWEISKQWFPMKLWTQARQMGNYAARCILADEAGETIFQDISFDLFCHVTRFFSFKVILLGLFNGQKLENNYEILLRMTKNVEYIKVLLQDGKMQGAILIGETDLEETFENLILSQFDLTGMEDDILNPDIDIEDYFD